MANIEEVSFDNFQGYLDYVKATDEKFILFQKNSSIPIMTQNSQIVSNIHKFSENKSEGKYINAPRKLPESIKKDIKIPITNKKKQKNNKISEKNTEFKQNRPSQFAQNELKKKRHSTGPIDYNREKLILDIINLMDGNKGLQQQNEEDQKLSEFITQKAKVDVLQKETEKWQNVFIECGIDQVKNEKRNDSSSNINLKKLRNYYGLMSLELPNDEEQEMSCSQEKNKENLDYENKEESPCKFEFKKASQLQKDNNSL